MAEGGAEAEMGDPNGTCRSSCDVAAAKRTEALWLAKGACIPHVSTTAKPASLWALFSLSYLIQAHTCPSEPHQQLYFFSGVQIPSRVLEEKHYL